MSKYAYYNKLERDAVERLDVLETELPREICQVKGCDRRNAREWPGNWGTRWICARHLPMYRVHNQILRRIRSL